MHIFSKINLSLFLAVVVLALVATENVWAAGTPAGTVINSQATGNYYDANGNFRDQVSSNTVSFVVRKSQSVDVSATSFTNEATPGDTSWHSLTIENIGNDGDTVIVHFALGFDSDGGDGPLPEDKILLFVDNDESGTFTSGDYEYTGDLGDVTSDELSENILDYPFMPSGASIRDGNNDFVIVNPDSISARLDVMDVDDSKDLLLGIVPDRMSAQGRQLTVGIYITSVTQWELIFNEINGYVFGDTLTAHDKGDFLTEVAESLEPNITITQHNSAEIAGSEPVPGDTIVYRLQLKNEGDGAAYNTLFTLSAKPSENFVKFVPNSIKSRRIYFDDLGGYDGSPPDDIIDEDEDFLVESDDSYLSSSGAREDSLGFNPGINNPVIDRYFSFYDFSDSLLVVALNALPPRDLNDPSKLHGVVLYYKVVVADYVRNESAVNVSPNVYWTVIDLPDDVDPTEELIRKGSLSVADVDIGHLNGVKLQAVKAYDAWADRDSSSKYVLPVDGVLDLKGDPDDTLYYEFTVTNEGNDWDTVELEFEPFNDPDSTSFEDVESSHAFFFGDGSNEPTFPIDTTIPLDILDSTRVIVRIIIPVELEDQDFSWIKVLAKIPEETSASDPSEPVSYQKTRSGVTAPFVLLSKWIMSKADFESEEAFYDAQSADMHEELDFDDFNAADASPGDTLAYMVRIYNDGEGSAKYVEIVDDFGGDNLLYVPKSAVVQGVLFPNVGRRSSEASPDSDEAEVIDSDHSDYSSVVTEDFTKITALIQNMSGYYEWQLHCFVILN